MPPTRRVLTSTFGFMFSIAWEMISIGSVTATFWSPSPFSNFAGFFWTLAAIFSTAP